jgi:hypothetical protein
MQSTKRLVLGAAVAAVTAALVWGPTAILAGLSFNGLD